MPRAQRDLAGIFDYIGAHSGDAAHTWYLGLKNEIRSLSQTPLRCPKAPENADLRHLLYGAKPHVYRVIFRVVEKRKEVEILHIRHGARQQVEADELK